MIISIKHEADEFGDLPESFAQWELGLSFAFSKLYKKLRDPWLDGKSISTQTLGGAIGLSRTKTQQGLMVLEANGFISVDESETPPCIVVRDMPEPPADLEEISAHIGRQYDEQQKDEIDAFRRFWADLYSRNVLARYTAHAGRDISLTKKLIHSHGLRRIKSMARWYWIWRDDEEPTDIGYFYTNFDRLVAERQDLERRLYRG